MCHCMKSHPIISHAHIHELPGPPNRYRNRDPPLSVSFEIAMAQTVSETDSVDCHCTTGFLTDGFECNARF